MTAKRSTTQGLYPAKSIEDFLGIWRVESITDGTIIVSGTWARLGNCIGLYRNYNQVCMFGDTDFSYNRYEQFHFEYDDKTGFLTTRHISPGVHVIVGFSDEELTKIFFSFTGRTGADNNTSGPGWGGGSGDNP